MRPVTHAATIAVAMILAAAAQADPDATIPPRISDKVVAELAKADLDAVSADAAKYMGPQASENIKNNFASVKNLGASQYTELVYERDYGKTGKDFIYKIDFNKAFTYVRLLWNIDNGAWHITHLTYKTDNDNPFPAGWEHIYPK
jgi:hypothetical protein